MCLGKFPVKKQWNAGNPGNSFTRKGGKGFSIDTTPLAGIQIL